MARFEPHRPHTASVAATGREQFSQISPSSASWCARCSATVVSPPSFTKTLYVSLAVSLAIRLIVASSLAISSASDERCEESPRHLRRVVHGDRDLLHSETERGPDVLDV